MTGGQPLKLAGNNQWAQEKASETLRCNMLILSRDIS